MSDEEEEEEEDEDEKENRRRKRRMRRRRRGGGIMQQHATISAQKSYEDATDFSPAASGSSDEGGCGLSGHGSLTSAPSLSIGTRTTTPGASSAH